MITRINESKTLRKHISCECKYKFDGRKGNSNQWWNKDQCWCECKKHHICAKVWNLATCCCKNGKYLASIIDDSIIKCDEIKDANAEAKSYDEAMLIEEETKAIPINFNEKTSLAKHKISTFYFSWITITDSCYCLLFSDKISRKTETFIPILCLK